MDQCYKKILLGHHKPKQMRCNVSLKAVWSRSMVPECITGCSPIPCLLARIYCLFKIIFWKHSFQSPQKSCGLLTCTPLCCGCKTNDPARLGVQEILSPYCCFYWYMDAFFFLGHFPYVHFWVMDFSFSGCLIQN